MGGHSKNTQVIFHKGVVRGDSMSAENEIDLIDIKNKKIKKELSRFKKIFKDIPENRKKLVEKTIENAAFMSVTLEELSIHIKTYGVKEKYQNGDNQYGYKESIESKTYNNMIKNYITIIKQLNDLLPDEKKINEDDEFDKFNDLS